MGKIIQGYEDPLDGPDNLQKRQMVDGYEECNDVNCPRYFKHAAHEKGMKHIPASTRTAYGPT